MSPSVVQLQLDAYLSVREALGFQMRAERTLLYASLSISSNPTGSVCPSEPLSRLHGPVPYRNGEGQVGPRNV
jgi:hypothetical protein